MRLYVANERRIHAFIFTLVHNWTVTDDIHQDVAQVMWSKFHEFKPNTNFTAWALRIARYKVMTYMRTQKRKNAFNIKLAEQLDQQAFNYAAKEDKQQEALKICLQKLSERDRYMIDLRYELDSTVKEVALRINRSIKTVYYSLNRIHLQLFQCIRRHIFIVGEKE